MLQTILCLALSQCLPCQSGEPAYYRLDPVSRVWVPVYRTTPAPAEVPRAGRPAVSQPDGAVRVKDRRSGCVCSPGCDCGDNCKCGEKFKPCNPGCVCVAGAKAKAKGESKIDVPLEEWQTSGVEKDKMPKDAGKQGQGITRNGKPITYQEAMELLGGKKDKLPDDKDLLRVTVIGPEAARKQVTDDIKNHAALAPWKGRILVQSYDPADPLIQGMGFAPGNPAIYCQTPAGQVIHRQEEYRGAEKLAEALRRADPAYDPKKDPDMNKAPVLPWLDWEWLKKIPPTVWVLGGLGLVLFFLSRQQNGGK